MKRTTLHVLLHSKLPSEAEETVSNANLPVHIWAEVCTHMTTKDWARAAGTCKAMAQVTHDAGACLAHLNALYFCCPWPLQVRPSALCLAGLVPVQAGSAQTLPELEWGIRRMPDARLLVLRLTQQPLRTDNLGSLLAGADTSQLHELHLTIPRRCMPLVLGAPSDVTGLLHLMMQDMLGQPAWLDPLLSQVRHPCTACMRAGCVPSAFPRVLDWGAAMSRCIACCSRRALAGMRRRRHPCACYR